jgi:hypothetical protein
MMRDASHQATLNIRLNFRVQRLLSDGSASISADMCISAICKSKSGETFAENRTNYPRVKNKNDEVVESMSALFSEVEKKMIE